MFTNFQYFKDKSDFMYINFNPKFDDNINKSYILLIRNRTKGTVTFLKKNSKVCCSYCRKFYL